MIMLTVILLCIFAGVVISSTEKRTGKSRWDGLP